VEAVAERMADYVVGHHPTMPGAGKTEHAVHSTRRREDRLHPCIMTIALRRCKTMAAFKFSLRVLRDNCSKNSSTAKYKPRPRKIVLSARFVGQIGKVRYFSFKRVYQDPLIMQPTKRYSWRKMTMGSTREARCAGM
jgi:hypothetical protein